MFVQEIRAKDRKISLKFGKSVEKGCYVYADRTRIFQVISNLVVNSINYGVEGGLTTVSYYDMDKAILVQVRDNSIGMPESELPGYLKGFTALIKANWGQGGTG